MIRKIHSCLINLYEEKNVKNSVDDCHFKRHTNGVGVFSVLRTWSYFGVGNPHYLLHMLFLALFIVSLFVSHFLIFFFLYFPSKWKPLLFLLYMPFFSIISHCVVCLIVDNNKALKIALFWVFCFFRYGSSSFFCFFRSI